MELPKDLSLDVLKLCNYRNLQQVAKAMGLPSNVKKMYLIEMIYAKKYSSPENLQMIVNRIKAERRLAAKTRKPRRPLKKRVQGMKISSTSNQSPPICTTPNYVPDTLPGRNQTIHSPTRPNPTIMRYNTSILNPLITKQALNRPSDRVLRSYNRVRHNMYSILNINNSVLGVIKAQNTLQRSEVQERRYEWNDSMQTYRPVKVTVERKQSVIADDFMSSQLRSVDDACTSQRLREHFDSGEDKQMVPSARTTTDQVRSRPIRERQSSHIYPLTSYEQTNNRSAPAPIVACRRQYGRIVKPNSLVQKPDRTTSNMIKNKMTQATARKYTRPLFVSLRDVMRHPNMTTVQDVVNYKIDGSFSNSSTESASTDKECQTRNTTSHKLTAFLEKKNSVVNAGNSGAEVISYGRQVPGQYAIDKTYNTEGNLSEVARRRTGRMYGMDNQNKGNRDRSIQNERRLQSREHITENPEKEVMSTYAIERENAYRTKTYSRANRDTQVGQSYERHDYQPYATYNLNAHSHPQDRTSDVYNNGQNRTYTEAYNKPKKNTFTEIYKKYIENRDSTYKSRENVNANNSVHSVDPCDQVSCNESIATWNSMSMNVQSTEALNAQKDYPNMTAVNIQSTEARNTQIDYPNMTALTDVYPENVPELVLETTQADKSSMSVYYHKNTRAEEDRSQRKSVSFDRRGPEGSLPRIADVFSQFQDPRYEHLTQPLYVDVGNNAENVNTTSALEIIYNFKWSGLVQPVKLQYTKEVATDMRTKLVYSAPIMTAAVAHVPATVAPHHADLAPASQPFVMFDPAPLLQEHTKVAQQEHRDVRCEEGNSPVLQKSPVSPLSLLSSSLDADTKDVASTGTAEMEDALDLISQDGDYMERIGMDVRTQCIVCDWAGPRSILEYHVRTDHMLDITVREDTEWLHSISVGAAFVGVKELNDHHSQIYVVHAACNVTSCFNAFITMLPKDDTYTEDLAKPAPKHARLTVYNKVTGEPYAWEGPIPFTTDETDSNGLHVNLTSLDLVPNSANLKLVNREWVGNSTVKVVAGQPELDSIEIALHVQIFNLTEDSENPYDVGCRSQSGSQITEY